ncbi:uncharacterized protein [Dermacentor albipictus]|uniref:uncharacterized protein isoform X1 n=1 Tax=Dermacentor albipictus TaxID=60249 RepID=UPI0031FE0BA3
MTNGVSLIVLMAVICTVSSVPLNQPGQEQDSVHSESPQSAYLGLPSGSDDIVSPIDISFSCAHRSLGYYADIANECKIFHVCNPVLLSDGQVAMMQYSFVCPNTTMFDQQSLTCTNPPGTAPCQQAESFYYLNRHVGQGGIGGVPVGSPSEQPRPAVYPEPKHQAPVDQSQPEPVPAKPASEDDSVVRPASYYGGKSS